MRFRFQTGMLLFLSLAVVLAVLAAPPPAGAIVPPGEALLLVADTGAANSPSAGAQPQVGGPPPSPASKGEYWPGRHGWGGGEGYGPRYHSRWKEMESYLGLTKDQTDRIRDIWTRYFVDTRDLRFDLAEKWLEMHRLFTDPKAQAPAILAKDKELMAIRDRLMTRRAEAMVECRSVLTPEQMQKLDVMVMSHYWIGMGGMHPARMMGHGFMRPGWGR